MVDIIVSDTSPLLYLHRIAALDWLPKLGEEMWVPRAVQKELGVEYSLWLAKTDRRLQV